MSRGWDRGRPGVACVGFMIEMFAVSALARRCVLADPVPAALSARWQEGVDVSWASPGVTVVPGDSPQSTPHRRRDSPDPSLGPLPFPAGGAQAGRPAP